MSAPEQAPDAGIVAAHDLTEISSVVRDYLIHETDVTRPAFNATALTARLAPVVAGLRDKAVEDARAEDRKRLAAVEAHVRTGYGDCYCGWKYDREADDMLGQYRAHLRAALHSGGDGAAEGGVGS